MSIFFSMPGLIFSSINLVRLKFSMLIIQSKGHKQLGQNLIHFN